MSIYKMNNAQTMKFVEMYRDAECLWKVGSVRYKDRDARDQALKKIAEAMHIEGFGPREVAQKIKNIRSAYYQELKKISYCEKQGNVYTPRVPWFQVFDSFLRTMVQIHPSMSSLEKREVEELSSTQDNPDICYSDDAGSISEPTAELDVEGGVSRSVKPCPASKKIKITSLASVSPSYFAGVVSPQTTSKVVSANDETEFDIWARSVAIQLNSMDLSRALRLQLQIQTLLSEERIAYESVREDSSKSNHKYLSAKDFLID